MEGISLRRYKLIKDFEETLSSNQDNYSFEIEKLRMEIAECYTNILEFKIFNKDLNKLMSIEHFEQNENIKTVELVNFIPDDF